jgi:hypothetical protein
MRSIRKLITPTWRPLQAAAAGLIATAVYSVAMEYDKYLIGNYFNDVRFIEGIVEGKRQTRQGKAVAWGIHMLNGVVLAELYAAVVKRWLPGPNWLRGALFGELFITGAWTMTPVADKYHPLIKSGEQPRLANWRSFGQNLLRHFIFGLVLGLLYQDKK